MIEIRDIEANGMTFGPVTAPSLLIWGKDDPYVRRMSIDLAPEYMRGPYRVVELDGGHWIAQEHPERVASEAVAHLSGNPI
jgi:pimeloyl-ACP methyl ester carboxylesterase